MLTAWRRLPYLDPGIPLELLPAAGRGEGGRAVRDLDDRLREPAAKHAAQLIIGGGREDRVPEFT